MDAIVTFLVSCPVWTIVALSVSVTLVAPVTLWWLSYASPLKGRMSGVVGVEPAIIGAVGLLFGLFAAFLANDIWARNQLAENAVVQEGDAIRTLARYAEGMSPKYNAQMRDALVDYVKTVIERDWPKMAEGSRSKELLGRVRTISAMIVTGDIGKTVGPAIQGRMIDAYTQMRDNRQARVQLAESRKLTIKWYALIIFGLLTQIAVSIVHVNRPVAHFTAQLIFSAAFAACLAILMVNEFPFSQMNPISPDPLQKAMESLYRN